MKNMKTFKYIGLIVGGNTEKIRLGPGTGLYGYTFKKVLIGEDASENVVKMNYPEAEIVRDKHSLMHDATLDLIVVASPVNKHSALIGEVLKSGKSVRVISQI